MIFTFKTQSSLNLRCFFLWLPRIQRELQRATEVPPNYSKGCFKIKVKYLKHTHTTLKAEPTKCISRPICERDTIHLFYFMGVKTSLQTSSTPVLFPPQTTNKELCPLADHSLDIEVANKCLFWILSTMRQQAEKHISCKVLVSSRSPPLSPQWLAKAEQQVDDKGMILHVTVWGWRWTSK